MLKLLSRGGNSGAVEQRRCFFLSAAAPLFLRWSSDQRSSASVKIIDFPLPLLQKLLDFEDYVLCSNLIIKSQLKSKFALLEIITMKQINEKVMRSDSVRPQAMFH